MILSITKERLFKKNVQGYVTGRDEDDPKFDFAVFVNKLPAIGIKVAR